MGRLPFDPDKMAAGRRDDDRPISVADLAARIDATLRRGMGESVRVVGEVSGFRARTHWYFDLKDASAVVSCVMFQSSLRRVGFTPKDGQEVVVKGRVEFWPKGGRLSLMCDAMSPVGEGALDLEFRRLCERLRSLGWFDEARKRPLPPFPSRIAVVTSATGAALQDVLDTARKRCPAVDILVVDVRVQGDGAAAEIARTITRLGARAHELAIDAILLTRGGGSKEDLWAFNDESLARAIVESPLVVVAAIGHESDTTIAELVADRRCATPTQAAMALVPDAAALLREVQSAGLRMRSGVMRLAERAAARVQAARARPWLRDPARLIEMHRARSAELARTLGRIMARTLSDRRARLERVGAHLERHRPAVVHARLDARLDATSNRLQRAMTLALANRSARAASAQRELDAIAPHRVLDRGYSWTTREDGSLLPSARNAIPGEMLTTVLRDGQVRSRVVGGETPTPDRAAGPRPRITGGTREQLDLF